MADNSILERTQAFIIEQRALLMKQRETIFEQQQHLQIELDAVNEMLRKFDAFEGKAAATPARASQSRRAAPRARRGSKREQLLQDRKSVV